MGMVKLVIDNASDEDMLKIRHVHEKMVKAFTAGNCSVRN